MPRKKAPGPDPAYAEMKRFPKAAKSAAFRAVLADLAALCTAPPKPYRSTDYPLHDEAEAVLACRFDKAKLRVHFGKAKGTSDELLTALRDEVRAEGFSLVENTDAKGESVRLLLPTADPLAVVYAHYVNTNGLGDLDEVVAGLRKVYALAPFVVTACGHDTIAGEHLKPVPAKKAAKIDEILNDICPPEDFFDGEELDEEAEEAEDDPPGRDGFFLWWD